MRYAKVEALENYHLDAGMYDKNFKKENAVFFESVVMNLDYLKLGSSTDSERFFRC